MPQTGGKFDVLAGEQRGRRVPRERRLFEAVAEDAQVRVRRSRAIGEHDVETVERVITERALQGEAPGPEEERA